MSWNDDEIDKLVKDAFNERTFEFRNEYWQDIEKQLPVSVRRKPITIFYFTLVFVSVISIGVGLFNWNKNTPSTSSPIVTRSNLSNVQKKLHASQRDPFENHVSGNATAHQFNVVKPRIVNLAKSFPTQSANNTVKALLADSSVTVTENHNRFNGLDIQNSDLGFVDTLSIKKTDNIQQLDNQLERIKCVSENAHTPKIRFWTETVAGMGQIWVKNNTTSQFANTSIGFNAGIQLPMKRFSFSIGAGFKSTFFDKLMIYERTKIYGFGVNELEHTYTFKSVVSLALPMSLNYSFGRQSFGFNVNPNANISCSLNKTQFMNGNKLDEQNGIANVNLFQKYGFETGISYDYLVNEKLKVGMRLNIQLIQPIDSERFSGTPVNKPIEGQFYIRRILGL